MLRRCNSTQHKSYAAYGGRGITVCAQWSTFENFYADLGDPPDGMSLGRIDNNGNYEPGNCRWETTEQQSNNRRSSRFIDTPRGRMTLSQAANVWRLPTDTLKFRVDAGWPIEKALTQPIKVQKNNSGLVGGRTHAGPSGRQQNRMGDRA